MAIKKPNVDQLRKIAAEYHMELSEEDLESFQGLISGATASYERVGQFVEEKLPVKYARTPGYRPDKEENPLNAWYVKTSLKGNNTGKLKGKKIAIKDNISLAGVPMMNGSSLLESFVPDIDATVATRILDAGGEIAGKAVCEDLCFSGSSYTSVTGPVLNPHNTEYATGGSSSGCGALVASGDVDMAVGCDQGGSIRIPSCWCGIYGLKPSHGLVPYTGIFPIEPTLDHVGPMARTIEDVALLLEVLAGADGLDPRQTGLQGKAFSKTLANVKNNLKIGIVKEGFGWEGMSEEDVDTIVKEAAYSFGRIGAKVEEVSIPLHRDGIHIWNVIATDGATDIMIRGNGYATGWKGYYDTKVVDYFGQAKRTRANDFSETVKLVVLQGSYMLDNYNGRYYAIAQNVAVKLRQAYDDALKQYDILIMPTVPFKATRIPGPDVSKAEYIGRALEMVMNTAPFDITGHPAINVPCGKSGGLPVGMMIIGRFGEDETVLQAAYAFDKMNG